VRLVPAALTCAALVLASPAFAEPAAEKPIIYECRDAQGNVAFQDDPCPPAPTPAPAPKTASKAKPLAKGKPKASQAPAPSPPAKPAPRLVVVGRPRDYVLPKTTIPIEPFRPADPRWASPETTLKTFVSAVAAGDRELVIACLTSSALSDLGPEAEALPLDELRRTVGSFTGYVAEGDLGPYWSIRALRAGGRPKWIFFEKTGSGEWKIGGI